MIKRTIIAAAAGVAFVLAGSACEDEPEGIEATEEAVEERVEADYEREPFAEERAEERAEETGTVAGTGTTTAAESDKFAQEQEAQQPGAGLGMTGMEEEREELGMGPAPGQEALDQPMAQQQGEPMAHQPGEPTSTQSDIGYSQTLARIQRELRTNDMQVVGRVRLNQQQLRQPSEAVSKPEEEQAQAGQPQQTQRPRGQQRAELILFADPNALGVTATDPMQALSMPTAILVYEDELSGEVFVAYDDPSLSHIVDAAVHEQPQGMQQQQPGQQQQGQPADWQSKPEEEQPGTGTGTDLEPEPGTDVEQEPGMGTDPEHGQLDY